MHRSIHSSSFYPANPSMCGDRYSSWIVSISHTHTTDRHQATSKHTCVRCEMIWTYISFTSFVPFYHFITAFSCFLICNRPQKTVCIKTVTESLVHLILHSTVSERIGSDSVWDDGVMDRLCDDRTEHVCVLGGVCWVTASGLTIRRISVSIVFIPVCVSVCSRSDHNTKMLTWCKNT